MIPLSVLDLSPVSDGSTAAQSFKNTVELAQLAEKLGFKRYWLAEHHNMPGIASAATSVVIGHVAAHTKTIRVGAGGIMLPNHAPLVIAEQFGTLESLFPRRIDLGLGRAPGTDQGTAFALRRNLNSDANQFPQDVVELLHYFKDVEDGQKVQAVPGGGLNVPVWILGSSLFGAQLAAMLGLPYAFASHFAPAEMYRAIEIYRERFEPSEYLSKPYVMLGLNVITAPTDEEARILFSSQLQAFVNLRTNKPGKLPAPIADYEEQLDSRIKAAVMQSLSCAVIAGEDSVGQKIAEFASQTGADELMITGMIFDHNKRLNSYKTAMTAYQNYMADQSIA